MLLLYLILNFFKFKGNSYIKNAFDAGERLHKIFLVKDFFTYWLLQTQIESENTSGLQVNANELLAWKLLEWNYRALCHNFANAQAVFEVSDLNRLIEGISNCYIGAYIFEAEDSLLVCSKLRENRWGWIPLIETEDRQRLADGCDCLTSGSLTYGSNDTAPQAQLRALLYILFFSTAVEALNNDPRVVVAANKLCRTYYS